MFNADLNNRHWIVLQPLNSRLIPPKKYYDTITPGTRGVSVNGNPRFLAYQVYGEIITLKKEFSKKNYFRIYHPVMVSSRIFSLVCLVIRLTTIMATTAMTNA